MTDVSLLPRFDPTDPALLDDPYPIYAALRAAGPLSRGAPGQWVVHRYDDVRAALRDRRLGAEFPARYQEISAGTGPSFSFRRRMVLNLDPPEHTRIVRMMSKSVYSNLSHDGIRVLVDDLLEHALDRGELDAMADLALPLASTVMCELIGIPQIDRDQLRQRVLDLGAAFIPYVPPERRDAVDETVTWLRGYLSELLRQRQRDRRDDLLSNMAQLQADGAELTDEEAVDHAAFLSFAGFETTVNLIAAGCSLLAGDPDSWRLLRADPALVPGAVEEMLRYESPIQMTGRFVREPVEVGGRTLRAGRMVLLLLASANHDESRFPEPGRFVVDRDPNPHLGFGGGAHVCLGAQLARVEARTLFGSLVERVAELGQPGPLERDRRPVFRGIRRAPVVVRPA